MRIKKGLLLASTALAAAAVTLPASASATTTIVDNNAAINATIIFTGSFTKTILGTGIQCTNVDVPVAVNGDSIEIVNILITNPTTECHFEGAVFSNCEFHQHPSTTGFPLVADLTTNTEKLTVTGNTTGGFGRINSELKSRPGKNCLFTTNDITIPHNETNSIAFDIETNAAGFITALKLSGTVKTDRGCAGCGTVVTEEFNSSITGTFHIAAASQNTYQIN